MKTRKKLICLLAMTTLATSLPIHAAALIGDLNNDGFVNEQDAKILTEYFAGYPHTIDKTAADVDADGVLTRKDGMILNRYADGWEGYGIATEEEAATAIYTQALDEEHIQTATFTEEDETYESMYVDNEILVVVDEDLVGREYVETLVEPYGGTVVGQVPIVGFYQVEIEGTPTLTKLEEVIDAVSDAEYVEDAYLNTVMELFEQSYRPNDDFAEDPLIHYHFNGYPLGGINDLCEDPWQDIRTWHYRAINITEAWELYNSVDIQNIFKIGIIDGGFDENHPDLNLKIVDFANKKYNSISYPQRANHGTHVAGIIGATTNNRIGIAGIVPNADILCVSTRSNENSLLSESDMQKYYLKLINNGCKVINKSLCEDSGSFNEAISKTSHNLEKNLLKLIQKDSEKYDFVLECVSKLPRRMQLCKPA